MAGSTGHGHNRNLGVAEPEAAAAHSPPEQVEGALRTVGACVVPPPSVRAWTGTGVADWRAFAGQWESLAVDEYAAAQGTRRLRRYGEFTLDAATGEVGRRPHSSFVQPENSNPLYVGVERRFAPLHDAFASHPVLRAVLGCLGRLATSLDAARSWVVKVHPFRVVASADAAGDPTPEGLHRDGVTLVSSLLIGRGNATGGESTVTAPDGRALLTTTLREPGTLLVGDDRHTLHGVSPIRPADPERSAHRDVLVVTFTPG